MRGAFFLPTSKLSTACSEHVESKRCIKKDPINMLCFLAENSAIRLNPEKRILPSN